MLFAKTPTTLALTVVAAFTMLVSTAAALEHDTAEQNVTRQVQESVEPRAWYDSPFAMIGLVVFAVLIVGALVAIAARDRQT